MVAGEAPVSGAALGAAAGNTDCMTCVRVSVGFGAVPAGGAFVAVEGSAVRGVVLTVFAPLSIGAGVAAAVVADTTATGGESGAGLSTRCRQRESI